MGLLSSKFRSLIDNFAVTGTQLDEKCKQAFDVDYWLRLNPTMVLESRDPVPWDNEQPPSPEALIGAAELYSTQGYLSMKGGLRASEIDKVRRAVEQLLLADWPPVFAFVYDNLWWIPKTTLISNLAPKIGHPNYKVAGQVWTHYVYPVAGNRGWIPHLDGNSRTPHSTTIWLPLGPATVTNGCMYLVRRIDETDHLTRHFHEIDSFTRPDVFALLKNIRALPAEPGDLLCWDDKILHWSGYFEAGEVPPRVSITLTVISLEPGRRDSGTLVEPLGPLPSLRTRLWLIGASIMSYRRFEPLMERFVPLAQRLMEQH